MFEKIKQNKFLNVIWNIIYTILVILVLLILVVVALQRFSNNKIALGGFRIFNIVTESMVPVYNVGDVILDKQVDIKDLKKGDDITYQGKTGDFAGKIVTHRIESIEQNEDGTYKIITKGIANSLEDPEITGNDVQGKVIYKFWTLSLLSKIIYKDLKSMYFLIFIPIAVIIFINIRKIYLSIFNKDENDSNSEDDSKKESDDDKNTKE